MKSTVPLIALLLCAGVPLARAQDATPLSILSGLFTAEQAQRGKSLYNARCGACHGLELIADDASAGDITGLQFRLGWHGKTVAERYETLRTTMPPGRSDILSDQEHLDIVTYILQVNGYPAGKEELKPELERLKRIVIVPLERPAGAP